MYYFTMQITFLTRKFRNGERNLHCDVVHITTKWVSSLTLDCNGVFAIKAYGALLVVTVCRPEPWIMHYVVQSLANEVPALFLPSAIFGHIRSEGALLLCVVSWAGLSFICFSS